jgi:hypothetical protein
MTNQNPVPVSGLAAVLAIVQAVVAVVPRWLVVAAGLMALTDVGFNIYMNARAKVAEVRKIEIESEAMTMPPSAVVDQQRPFAMAGAAKKMPPPAPLLAPKPQDEMPWWVTVFGTLWGFGWAFVCFVGVCWVIDKRWKKADQQ